MHTFLELCVWCISSLLCMYILRPGILWHALQSICAHFCEFICYNVFMDGSAHNLADATSSTKTVLIYLNLIHCHIILLFIWIRAYLSQQLVPSPKSKNPNPKILNHNCRKLNKPKLQRQICLTRCLLQTTTLYKSFCCAGGRHEHMWWQSG